MGPFSDGDGPARSILRDLRGGEAGCLPRIAISVAAGVALAACAVFVLGIADQLLGQNVRTYTSGSSVFTYQTSRVRDEHVAIVTLMASALWFFLLTRIWSGYRRARVLLKSIFGVLGMWAVAIPLCIVIDAT
ncbi:MAG: hypothetical protein ACYS7M_08155, partial [Planctomycetota bacterium]